MFSDDSINIHYRAPTSRLLKMNTFNEFELNRIKRLYTDELASRLQRSKSSRLAQTGADWHQQQRRAASRSAERLTSSSRFRPQESPTDWCPARAVDLQRYQRAFLSRPGARPAARTARFGRALFDFQAKSERELSLRRGDLVELLELPDHSWAHVEDCQSGLRGLVPLAYIDYSVGCAVARRDVAGRPHVARGPSPSSKGPLLPMSKGEPIALIRRLSGHWYEASNTRQSMGLVWSNDLDIIKQPVLAERERHAQHGRLSSDELASEAEGVFEPEQEEEEMLILESGERVLARCRRRSASGASGAPEQPRHTRPDDDREKPSCGDPPCCLAAGPHCNGPPRRSSSSPYLSGGAPEPSSAHDKLPRLCRAKFAYQPRQDDELELVAGDLLMVVHQCDDGWFIGSSYSTNQTGTFPGNFVESV